MKLYLPHHFRRVPPGTYLIYPRWAFWRVLKYVTVKMGGSEVRVYLHRNPELGYPMPETTEYIILDNKNDIIFSKLRSFENPNDLVVYILLQLEKLNAFR